MTNIEIVVGAFFWGSVAADIIIMSGVKPSLLSAR